MRTITTTTPGNGLPSPNFEFEVLDGNDIPESWVGRRVGVQTITAGPGMKVGLLQSKSAWRLVLVVDDRTGEALCIPWIAVEAVSLLEVEAPGSPKMAAQSAEEEPHPEREGTQKGSELRWWRRVFGG